MANAASWANLHGIEPFGHSWLPASLSSTSSRAKALIMIWAVFGVLPAVVLAIVGLLEDTFFLEGEALPNSAARRPTFRACVKSAGNLPI